MLLNSSARQYWRTLNSFPIASLRSPLRIDNGKNKENCKTTQSHWLNAIAVGICEEHLRCDAPLELRERVAIRSRADLDSLPAYSRCTGSPRQGRGRGRWRSVY